MIDEKIRPCQNLKNYTLENHFQGEPFSNIFPDFPFFGGFQLEMEITGKGVAFCDCESGVLKQLQSLRASVPIPTMSEIDRIMMNRGISGDSLPPLEQLTPPRTSCKSLHTQHIHRE